MSFLANIFGPAIGDTVKGIGEGIGGLAIKLRTAITGIDPAAKAKLEKTIVELEHLSMAAQNEVNVAQAQHKSVFVAGARPFIMWVCGFGLGWQFVLQPIMNWGLYLYSSNTGIVIVPAPEIPIADLLTLLAGMLGFGGMRTYEKQKGIQNNH